MLILSCLLCCSNLFVLLVVLQDRAYPRIWTIGNLNTRRGHYEMEGEGDECLKGCYRRETFGSGKMMAIVLGACEYCSWAELEVCKATTALVASRSGRWCPVVTNVPSPVRRSLYVPIYVKNVRFLVDNRVIVSNMRSFLIRQMLLLLWLAGLSVITYKISVANFNEPVQKVVLFVSRALLQNKAAHCRIAQSLRTQLLAAAVRSVSTGTTASCNLAQVMGASGNKGNTRIPKI